jgi:hypothetical protein
MKKNFKKFNFLIEICGCQFDGIPIIFNFFVQVQGTVPKMFAIPFPNNSINLTEGVVSVTQMKKLNILIDIITSVVVKLTTFLVIFNVFEAL